MNESSTPLSAALAGSPHHSIIDRDAWGVVAQYLTSNEFGRLARTSKALHVALLLMRVRFDHLVLQCTDVDDRVPSIASTLFPSADLSPLSLLLSAAPWTRPTTINRHLRVFELLTYRDIVGHHCVCATIEQMQRCAIEMRQLTYGHYEINAMQWKRELATQSRASWWPFGQSSSSSSSSLSSHVSSAPLFPPAIESLHLEVSNRESDNDRSFADSSLRLLLDPSFDSLSSVAHLTLNLDLAAPTCAFAAALARWIGSSSSISTIVLSCEQSRPELHHISNIISDCGRCSSLTSLSISGAANTRPHPGFTPLRSNDEPIAIRQCLLSSASLTRLELRHCDLVATDYLMISSGIGHSRSLTTFSCRQSRLGTDEQFGSILSNISDSRTLQVLDLSESHIDDTRGLALSLVAARHPTLTSLHLESNEITNDGATQMLGVLQDRVGSFELDLEHNHVDSAVIRSIAAASARKRDLN